MARRNEDLESSYLVLKTQVTKMEKELDRLRKLTQELTSEISHFMFLDNGVNLVDSYGILTQVSTTSQLLGVRAASLVVRQWERGELSI
uniref:Uncharacterized protein n=1 Tax=Brassica oleracea TaxID=3712 RepID=A0A3P6DSW2_BRAOL|nr:unnamed protein product [Brassica oleracea]